VSHFRDSLAVSASFHAHESGLGFLLGPIPGHATWYYYPIAVLIKTPIPLLLLGGIAIFQVWRKKDKFPNGFNLLFPILFILLVSMLTRNHFGIRYLLPAIPFASALIGISYNSFHRLKDKRAFWILLVWLAGETFSVHPHHMAYFNEFIGGSKQGYKWMDGSNQDWGQDLPALASFLKKEGSPSVLLSYLGSNSPEAWGIHYQDVFSPSITSSFRPDIQLAPDHEKEYLVVSAGLLSHPTYRALFQWLSDKEHLAQLGYTLFVFDISRDVESTMKIATLYKQMGRMPLFHRQVKRARALNPNHPLLKDL